VRCGARSSQNVEVSGCARLKAFDLVAVTNHGKTGTIDRVVIAVDHGLKAVDVVAITVHRHARARDGIAIPVDRQAEAAYRSVIHSNSTVAWWMKRRHVTGVFSCRSRLEERRNDWFRKRMVPTK